MAFIPKLKKKENEKIINSNKLKIILTDGRSLATEIQDDCLPFLSDRSKVRTSCSAITRKIYFYFIGYRRFKQFA